MMTNPMRNTFVINQMKLLASGRLRERRLGLGDLERAEGLALVNSLRGWCPARLLPA